MILCIVVLPSSAISDGNFYNYPRGNMRWGPEGELQSLTRVLGEICREEPPEPLRFLYQKLFSLAQYLGFLWKTTPYASRAARVSRPLVLFEKRALCLPRCRVLRFLPRQVPHPQPAVLIISNHQAQQRIGRLDPDDCLIHRISRLVRRPGLRREHYRSQRAGAASTARRYSPALNFNSSA